MRNSKYIRALASASLVALALATPAYAQEAASPQSAGTVAEPEGAASQEFSGLQEIVVTAQRREQRLQDVPIAITAITQASIQANRIQSVTDLSGLAPNVTVRPAAGGSNIPAFSVRGITSYGVVPGSDKEVSIYLDGVYLGSPRGSLFELPDIARIEVLRGPQGTLFGRNATAGAVSIVTREPTGKFGVRQVVSAGNYRQFRTQTSVDLPAFGAFSVYGSFVHNERRGDIRNLGAGTQWDRTGPQTGLGVQTSPKYLGSKNAESYFAAVKFEPSDSFKAIYKFDHADEHFTPEGQAAIGINPAAPLIGSLLTALVNSQTTPVVFEPSVRRPKTVNNSFTVPGTQRVTGHSLTIDAELADSLSLKNISAYRKSFVTSASQLDGLGGLTFTPQALVPYAVFATFSRNPALATAPAATQAAAIGAAAQALAPLIGSRFVVIGTNAESKGNQYSNETQLNFTSELMDLTAGLLYFHQKDRSGGPVGLQNTFSFMPFPASGRIPLGNQGLSYNKSTSIAAYAQAEVHVTSQLDLVGGLRMTRDKKSGTYVSGGVYVPGPGGFTDGTFTGLRTTPFKYRDTQPSYTVGANFKPNTDILFYAKHSYSYVSGGSVGGVAFANETARAWEAGVKADLFDRLLRTNLAVFTTKYRNLQSAQSGTNVGRPDLGTVIIQQGDSRVKGFEVETTLAPTRGLLLNAGLGYTDANLGPVDPILVAGSGGAGPNDYKQTLVPKWNVTLSGTYETEPLFGEARALFRVDATWRDKQRTYATDARPAAIPLFASIKNSPQAWVVNGRMSLRDLMIGNVKGEIALWGRNLTNNKASLFPLAFANFAVSSSFQPARTYGADLIISF